MIDVKRLRQDPEGSRALLARRLDPATDALLDRIVALDRNRRELLVRAESLKAERNAANEEVARLKKAKEDATELLARLKVSGEEVKALDADGPARFNIAARQVTFQALNQLGPKQETKFRVRVQCVAAGDHRCHVQLTSDDMKTPVTKEEGTRVYADE